MAFDDFYNPLILPDLDSKRQSCPVCSTGKFTVTLSGGVAYFLCEEGHRWTGGLPREAFAPGVPRPPEPITLRSGVYPTFDVDPKTGEDIEVVRYANPTPDYRMGTLIPYEDEDV